MKISFFNKIELDIQENLKLKGGLKEIEFNTKIISEQLSLCLFFEGVRLDFVSEKEAKEHLELLKNYFRSKKFVYLKQRFNYVLVYERRV